MIAPVPGWLLYIEPQNPKSEIPIIDNMTRKMMAAFNLAKAGIMLEEFHEGGFYHGVQTCVCGARSTAQDYQLQNGLLTNSLCVHYLAWHRADVPQSELEKVATLPDEHLEPTSQLLQ